MKYIDLSKRQAAILDFIKKDMKEKGYPPSVREIGNAVGLSSTSTVHCHLTTLEKKGYLRRDSSKPRALEIMDDPAFSFPKREMVDIPIVGKVSAGLPIFAEENIEDTFSIPLDFVHSNADLFILRVSGESMIEAGFYNGDLLIVEKTSVVRNGDIAVILIEDEATVKTFYKENDHFRLQPENSSMDPIIVDSVEILGKPLALFRQL
ncbi:MAG: transcriptional repressor LexA [Bacillota bacterium]|jgi:repressor LexA